MTDQPAAPVPLHGEDQPPTRIERKLFKAACEKLEVGERVVPVKDLADELVRLGIPTVERAEQIIEAHFAPGGLLPVEKGGKPSLSWLVAKHMDTMSPPEFLARVKRYYPSITITEIIAAAEAHSARIMAEADALQRTNEIFDAWTWANAERVKGRDENEITWGECADDLDLLTPDGETDLSRLKLAGRKMVDAWRHATKTGAAQ